MHPALGPIWIVDQSPDLGEAGEMALHTCRMRGWVEIMEDAVPTGHLESSSATVPDLMSAPRQPVYRLTDGGWAHLRRSHALAVATFIVSTLAFVAAAMAVWFTYTLPG